MRRIFFVVEIIRIPVVTVLTILSGVGQLIDHISTTLTRALPRCLGHYRTWLNAWNSLLLSTALGAVTTIVLSVYEEYTTNRLTLLFDKLNEEALVPSYIAVPFFILIFLSAWISKHLENSSPAARDVYCLQKEKDGLCWSLLSARYLVDNQTTKIRIAIVGSIVVKVFTQKMAASILGTLLGLEVYFSLFKKFSSILFLLSVLAMVLAMVAVLAFVNMWLRRAEDGIGYR